MSPTESESGSNSETRADTDDPVFDAIAGNDDALDAEEMVADTDRASRAVTGHGRKGRVAADGGERSAGARDSSELRSDGGSVSEFEQMAEVSLTAHERRRQWFDEKLLAPARIVWSDWRARFGVIVVSIYLLLGTVGTMLVSEPSPNQGDLLIGAFRTLKHPFGTTASGTDIFSQVVHATPSMLIMIMSGAVFTVVLGTTVGTVAGYKGGRLDSVLMTDRKSVV